MAIPVTINDAARQLRLTADEANTRAEELQGFIDDAVDWVERYTGHILEARDVTEQFAGFARLQMKAWPVSADATPSVTYDDTAGNAVAVPSVRLSLARRSASVLPGSGSRWPAAARDVRVTVTLRAGYEPNDPLPGNFRRAILVLIGAYDSDREGGEILVAAEKSARSLCRDYRWRQL